MSRARKESMPSPLRLGNDLPQQTPTQQIPLYDFPTALRAVGEGRTIRKLEWADASIIVRLIDGYLMILLPDGPRAFTIRDGDLLGRDWYICG